jgi:Zn-dependent M28 family amino/carboxypeptidase
MVERAARAMNVGLSADPLPEQGLFTRSDHYPFVQAGHPVGVPDDGFPEWRRGEVQGLPRRQLS